VAREDHTKFLFGDAKIVTDAGRTPSNRSGAPADSRKGVPNDRLASRDLEDAQAISWTMTRISSPPDATRF
jgi:hypothetical protein